MKFDFDECVRQGVEQAMKECELKIGMMLKEAVEKQIPKRYVVMWDSLYGCPACETHVWTGQQFCTYCGQKLDWSEP